jgi:protein Mpv17
MMPNLGESGQEIVGRLKRDLLPTLKNGVLYWPICDFVTFKFIPVHLQVCLGHFSLSSLYMVGLTRVLRKNYISIFAAFLCLN